MSYCIKVQGTSQACQLIVLLPTNPADGANKIKQRLAQGRLASDIHMVGMSAGRAAIFSYLSRTWRGQVAVDARLRSAIAVDSPLGFQFPFSASDLILDLQAGIMMTAF